MEKLIVLGTGSGLTINCYSLSALLENTNGNYLLIDTGSGNQILNHLKAKNININKKKKLIKTKLYKPVT